jgi:hypothetical protein
MFTVMFVTMCWNKNVKKQNIFGMVRSLNYCYLPNLPFYWQEEQILWKYLCFWLEVQWIQLNMSIGSFATSCNNLCKLFILWPGCPNCPLSQIQNCIYHSNLHHLFNYPGNHFHSSIPVCQYCDIPVEFLSCPFSDSTVTSSGSDSKTGTNG